MNIITVFIFGMAGATAVTIGRTIGQDRREDAARMANTLLALSVALGVALGAVILLIRTPVLTLFAVSDGAHDIAYQLLTILGFLAPLQAFSCNLLVGVLRGGGDVTTNFILDCGTMWVIAIPLGALSGFVCKTFMLPGFSCALVLYLASYAALIVGDLLLRLLITAQLSGFFRVAEVYTTTALVSLFYLPPLYYVARRMNLSFGGPRTTE